MLALILMFAPALGMMVPAAAVQAASRGTAFTENYTAANYYPAVQAFIDRYGTRCTNCKEYADRYVRHMTGNPEAKPTDFPSYSNPSEVLPGDVIRITNHWLVVVDCNASGNTIILRTAEGNWPNGGVTVGNGIYKISGNVLRRNGSASRPFIIGYHIIGSFYKAARTCVESSFYAALYPDIRNSFGSDYERMLTHYLIHGVDEGRTASPSFSITAYIELNSDLKKAFGSCYRNAFYHYVTFGIYEGRNSSYFYSGASFLGRYADLRTAFGTSSVSFISAAEHFNTFGVKEGRQGNDTFSVQVYKNRYEDLRKVFGSSFMNYFIHYLQNGRREGRRTI